MIFSESPDFFFKPTPFLSLPIRKRVLQIRIASVNRKSGRKKGKFEINI